MIPTILALWGILAPYIGYRYGIKAQRKLKREDFVSFIELRLQRVQNGQVSEFCYNEQQTKYADFNQAVLAVRPHIEKSNINEFDKACEAHKNTSYSVLNEQNAKVKVQVISCLKELLAFAK